MKKVIFAFAILLLSGIFALHVAGAKEPGQAVVNTINVVCSKDLHSLASAWANEFSRNNPGTEIRISVASGEPGKPAGSSVEGIGFFNSQELSGAALKDAWKITVGREVTVPVINAANPYLRELNVLGITDEEAATLLNGQANWGNLAGNEKGNPVHLFVSNEEEVIAALEGFTGIGKLAGTNVIMKSPEEVVLAVRNDPFAIGFVKLSAITGASGTGFTEGISLLPIDKNKNGKIDYMESIYDRADNFARGVWIGKYPKILYSDIYCVSDQQPESYAEVAFIKWVLTSGQNTLVANNLTGLVPGERQSKLAELIPIEIIAPAAKPVSFPVTLTVILAVVLLAALVLGVAMYSRRNRKVAGLKTDDAVPIYFNKHSVNLPRGLYYDKSHTWAFMEKDGTVKVGIDDFLQHVTGPVTKLELRRPGEKVRKGDMILSLIQNGKRLVVFAPVSGIIRESNSQLDSKYTLINSAPYTDGWVYRIEPANWLREVQLMEMAEKYQTWLASEFSRLKDFLAGSLKVNKLEYEAIVLQDGGMLKDGVLEDFGPEVWEDFQSNFLDTAF